MNTSRSLLLGMLATTLLSSPAWAAEKVGVIGAAGATVTVTGADNQARVAKTGDDVFLGDKVTTDGSGKAQIIFLDRSSITLKPGSDLTIDTFVYDPSSSNGELAMKSAKGAFRFIGGALSKKKPVKLNTPVGTIGIRGGIADASISDSGKTDAFFLYGEEMSFTNQQGEQSSTRQFGTGLAVASADATPQPVPATQVAAHFDGFRVAPSDAPLPGAPDAGSIDRGLQLDTDASAPLPAAPSADNAAVPGTAGTPPQGPNDGGPNGSGPSGGSQNASGAIGGEPTGSSTPPQSNTSLAANTGEPPARGERGAAPGTPGARPVSGERPLPGGTPAPGTQTAARGSLPPIGGLPNAPLLEPIAPRVDTGVIATAAQTRVDGAINTAANTGLPLTGGGQLTANPVFVPTGTILPPPPSDNGSVTPPPPADNAGAEGVLPPPPVVATPILPVVGNAIAAAPAPLPPYTQFGRYATRNGTGSYPDYETSVLGRGGILGNTSGSGYDLRFNASTGPARPDLLVGDLVPTNGGFFDDPVEAIGGVNYHYRAYQPLSGAWTYAVLKDLSSFDQTTLIFGNSLVASNFLLSPAIADTRAFVNSASGGDSYNVSFFDFMPSTTQYQTNQNRNNLGLLGYDIFEPSQSLDFYGISPSQVPDAPLGMAVNWTSNKFLTGFMHWNQFGSNYANLKADTPEMTIAYGSVNPGGPDYFSGSGFSFRNVSNNVALNSTTTPDKFSEAGTGNLKVGMNIYGSPTNGIESMVVDVTGNGKDVSSISIDTINGSNIITVNAPNHGLANGAIVEIAVNASVAGISPGQINGLKTITVTGTNQYTFTTATSANASVSGSTAYILRPKVELDSQLAVARPLSASPDSAAIRADLVRTQSLPTTRTLQGFAGGLAIVDHKIAGTHPVRGFANTAPDQVVITQDKATGTVTGNLNLQGINAGDSISAGFSGESAFLGHRLWGVSQSSATLVEAGSTQTGTNTKGTLVAGTHIVDPTRTAVCKDCQFVEWGVWAGEFNKAPGTPVSVNMIPVVVGEVTNTAAVSGSPSAVYNGPAYGSFRNVSNRIQNSVGTMTANADLANKNINSVNLSFNNLFGSNNLAINAGSMAVDPSSTGKAVFSTTSASVTGYHTGTGTATINGALFGPSGQEIGGNFRIDSAGTLIQSSGVFLGKQ